MKHPLLMQSNTLVSLRGTRIHNRSFHENRAQPFVALCATIIIKVLSFAISERTSFIPISQQGARRPLIFHFQSTRLSR